VSIPSRTERKQPRLCRVGDDWESRAPSKFKTSEALIYRIVPCFFASFAIWVKNKTLEIRLAEPRNLRPWTAQDNIPAAMVQGFILIPVEIGRGNTAEKERALDVVR
jgi:hypothetical protein